MTLKLLYPPKLKNKKNRFKYFTIPSEDKKERFTCAICEDMLIEPQQYQCGCRFCECCLNEHIDDFKKFCLWCNHILEIVDNNFVRDKAVEKEIFELEIRCINESCENKCKLKCLVDHLEICEYGEIKCEDCGMEMTKKVFKETHRNVRGIVDKLCDNWMSVCPCGCCEEVQDNVKIHLAVCPRLSVDCIYKNIGCTKMCPRCDMDDHVWNDVRSHFKLLANMESFICSEAFGISNSDRKMTLKMTPKMKEDLSQINILKEGLLSKMKEDLSQINILKKRQLSRMSKNADLQIVTQILKQSLNLNSKKSPSPPAVVSLGQYSWVIKNIEQVVQKAKHGANTEIFSEHFYTGNPGYKMCLKAYPNGDGKASRDYFSLYFVIMKGEYDDKLTWPFNREVSLSLLSQGTAHGNLTVNMKPVTNEKCYGKPQKQMNVAFGKSDFVSHVEMARYVHNGAISIQVEIS